MSDDSRCLEFRGEQGFQATARKRAMTSAIEQFSHSFYCGVHSFDRRKKKLLMPLPALDAMLHAARIFTVLMLCARDVVSLCIYFLEVIFNNTRRAYTVDDCLGPYSFDAQVFFLCGEEKI